MLIDISALTVNGSAGVRLMRLESETRWLTVMQQLVLSNIAVPGILLELVGIQRRDVFINRTRCCNEAMHQYRFSSRQMGSNWLCAVLLAGLNGRLDRTRPTGCRRYKRILTRLCQARCFGQQCVSKLIAMTWENFSDY